MMIGARSACSILIATAACAGGSKNSQAPPPKDAVVESVPQKPTEARAVPEHMCADPTLELVVSAPTGPSYDFGVEFRYHGARTISGMRQCDENLVSSSLVSLADSKKIYVNRRNSDGRTGPPRLDRCRAMPSPYQIVPGANGVLNFAFRDFVLLVGDVRTTPPPGDYILVISYVGCGTTRVSSP